MAELFVHDTALIDAGADVGEGTRVWHWAHVSSGAKVGAGCSLGQNVFIGGRAVVGNRVKIQNNVSIYDDVIIGDDVFCGPSCVFTNVINPRAHVVRKLEYLVTKISNGATLGANCTIVCGVTIGVFGFVGAGAVVNKDVPDFALVVGNPARQIGWMSAYGERLPLPLSGAAESTCPNDGSHYNLSGKIVTRTLPAADQI